MNQLIVFNSLVSLHKRVHTGVSAIDCIFLDLDCCLTQNLDRGGMFVSYRNFCNDHKNASNGNCVWLRISI